MTPGIMTDPKDILKFLHAGRARVTLVSQKTGKRFTYKVSQKEGGPAFVRVLKGSCNETGFAYIGYIPRNGGYEHGRNKSTVRKSAPSNLAFEYVYKALKAGQLPKNAEVWHEGRCGRCGRVLTDPSSIARGFGPECAGKVR